MEQVTILYEKSKVDGTEVTTYCLKPIGLLRGKFDEEKGVFITKNKEEYASYNSSENLLSDSKLFSGTPVTID